MRQILLKNVRKDPTQLSRAVYDNALAEPPHMVPESGSIVASMRRTRVKRMPKSPTKVNEVQISGKSAETISGEKFLVGHDKESGVVIFAPSKAWETLTSCETMLDGSNLPMHAHLTPRTTSCLCDRSISSSE